MGTAHATPWFIRSGQALPAVVRPLLVLVLAAVALVATSSVAGATTVVWGAPQVDGHALFWQGAACPPNSDSCVAVGDTQLANGAHQGSVVAVTDGVAGSGVLASASFEIEDLFGVACGSVGICVAVGQGGESGVGEGVVVPITNGVPGAASLVPGTSNLRGVACPTATTCYAVGTNDTQTLGAVVSITNGVPGDVQITAGNVSFLYGIECQGSAGCLAVGTNPEVPQGGGVVVSVENGSPGFVSTLALDGSVLDGIACETATVCEAVGTVNPTTGIIVPVTNGEPGAVTTTNTSGGSADFQFAVACPIYNDCLSAGSFNEGQVLDDQATIVATTGTMAGAIQNIPSASEGYGIACWSADQCIVAGAAKTGSGGIVAAIVEIATDPPSISNYTPVGALKSAYEGAVFGAGGIAPYTFSASGLPSGLTLNVSTGIITGTPTAAGTSSVTFNMTTAGSPPQTATEVVAITINPLVSVHTTTLPAGAVGAAYSTPLAAAGGTPPYTWSTTSHFPAGLSEYVAGYIAGTPTKAGTTYLTVKVTDSSTPAQTATSKSLKLVIAKGTQSISFTTTAPSHGFIGATYPVRATASSGLAVAFSIDLHSTFGACSYSNTTKLVKFLKVGTCEIDAKQAGNGNYLAAPVVTQIIGVEPLT